jgi:glyoxylase-like metal-dependent hydrolase (beta-lactamase superfamily II)
MKNYILRLGISGVLFLILIGCTPSENFVVQHQVTGPIETNCYLLYDVESKEAALFDVGGPIDSLLTVISEKNLKLKYIFATHCHMDHLEGVPSIRKKFPDALLCYNKEDYQDFLISIDWGIKHFDPKMTEALKQDSATAKWFEYDLTIFGPSDINLEDNQIYKLGNLEIRTILSPGHSKASICYYVGNVLFSGDVLFYRTAGRTDLLSGSKEALVNSVRRLYTLLPDETIVYPGHG